MLLSAPTAVVQGTTIRPTDWLVVVRYSDVDGDLRTDSIGHGDLAVVAPGYNETARLLQPIIPQNDGSVLAVYQLPAMGAAWDWRDNGRYELSVVGGEVVDAEGNQADGGRSYNLWFDVPTARVTATDITDYGRKWSIDLELSDNRSLQAIESGAAVVRIVSARGYVAMGRVTSAVAAGAVQTMTVTIEAPGGGFDYSDSSAYRVETVAGGVRDAVGNAAPVFTVYTEELAFTNPKVEVVSTARADDRFYATFRVSDDVGVNVSSLSGLAGTAIFESLSGIQYSKISRMIGEPRLQNDGSYLVDTYFPSKYVFWSWQESGRFQLVASPGVSDVTGVRANAARLAYYWMGWDTPTIAFDSSTSGVRSNGTIEVDVRIKARTGLAAGTISGDDLAMTGPGGSLYVPTIVSITAVADGYTRVRYRFTPSESGFPAGQYSINTVQGGIVASNRASSLAATVVTYTVSAT